MTAVSSTRVIIEADGGSRGNPGPAAYGALLRDADTGEVIAEERESIGTATNNVAEYRGLIAGLQLLRTHVPDANDVEVRMDSKLVIEQMAGRWKVKHPDMVPLASEAQRLRQGLDPLWTWVPRAENADADRLANMALDEAMGRSPRPTRGQPRGAADAEQPTPNRLVGWAPDLGDPTRMILLRHGQTGLTVDKRFSGAGGSDPALDDAGRAQADAAAAWLEARGGVDVVLSSPLTRTRQTAQVIADALGLKVQTEEGLRETAFGAWDGHTFSEVEQRWPGELAAWLGSTSVAPPDGESFDDVAVRVRRTRDRIVREHPGETVVAVTHVTPIKLMVCAGLRAPVSSVYRMQIAAGSISVVDWYADGATSVTALSQLP
ncbi:MAG TPA: bifunctional RNase H/acid phosphatase [Nocardioidaceae bacterium]|nr:bifunctional RNase H/acid phosphatase [Nocardioidaceae bacterium]